jgi:hypothetical protein
MNISLINGAHFESDVVEYLVKNIFQGVYISNISNISHVSNISKLHVPSKLNLCFSANLDTKCIPGKRNKDMYYTLDETILTPCVFWTGEPFNVHVNSITGNHKYLVISSLTTDGSSIRMPFASFAYIKFYIYDYINKYRPFSCYSKKKYLLAHCSTRKTKERTLFMNTLLKKVDVVTSVWCLGKDNQYTCSKQNIDDNHFDYSKENIPRTASLKRICSLIREYSNFKFVLAIENCEKDGYLTEKIINVFIAGSIPIYWGDHVYAKKLFNPNSFICIRDFDSYDSCIEYILNMTEEQINNMLQEPMFTDNIIPPEFDITNFEEGSFYGELKKQIHGLVL